METEKLIYKISKTQIFNIPIPFLIFSYLETLFYDIPVEKRSHLGEIEYSRTFPMGYRSRSYEKINDYPILIALEGLFSSNPSFLYYSLEHTKDCSQKVVNTISRYSITKHTRNLKKNIASLLEFLRNFGIDTDSLLFQIPQQESEKPKGMTDQQYSNYVLSYMVLKEYFEEIIRIEYY